MHKRLKLVWMIITIILLAIIVIFSIFGIPSPSVEVRKTIAIDNIPNKDRAR